MCPVFRSYGHLFQKNPQKLQRRSHLFRRLVPTRFTTISYTIKASKPAGCMSHDILTPFDKLDKFPFISSCRDDLPLERPLDDLPREKGDVIRAAGARLFADESPSPSEKMSLFFSLKLRFSDRAECGNKYYWPYVWPSWLKALKTNQGHLIVSVW